jgi:serine/threonine protein kinase
MALAEGARFGNYTLIREIGGGSFSKVWYASHVLSGNHVAIKVINADAITSPDVYTLFQRELSLLRLINHPFIAAFFEYFEESDHHFIVLEHVERGSLKDLVHLKGKLTEPDARRYFSQLLAVLEYLHLQLHVAHRDLKAEHVLLDSADNIKVIDFGFSNIISADKPGFGTACGSPIYAAPEIIKGERYTCSADIWSSGILLYFMSTGQYPHTDDDIRRLFQKIAFTEISYPDFLTPGLSDLLSKVLDKSPDRRLSLNQIKEHHWFSQSGYEAIRVRHSLDDPSAEASIDREIVDRMTALGVDCHLLPHQLITGEETELTSLYKQLHRGKMSATVDQSPVADSRHRSVVARPLARTLSARNSDKPRTQTPRADISHIGMTHGPSSPLDPHGIPNALRIGHTPTPVASVAKKLSKPACGMRRITLPSPPPDFSYFVKQDVS